MNVNKTFLAGRLTRNPELRYLPNKTPVCEFGLAVNRTFKGKDGEQQQEVDYFDVTAWGKQAEAINTYFVKGKPIFVEGRLRHSTWDDKQGGGKRSKLTVVMENFQFIGGNDATREGSAPKQVTPPPADDDIPFA